VWLGEVCVVSSDSLSTVFDLPAGDGSSDAAARELTLARVAFETVVVPTPRLLVRPTEFPRPTSAELVARQIDTRWQQALGGRSKRLLDIVTASTALVLLAPLMLIVTLLIYLMMGRPIFFPQKRIGLGGASFPCFKFRTMVNDADAALARHLEHNPEAAREWLASQKLRHDPRVTTLGRLLRQSSIDELPQLFSVLQGNMSCVGPRPIIEPEIIRYGHYWREYMRARPGLTGVWQVSGRNKIEYKTRIRLDRWYVRRWSIWLDLWLLVRTIPAVMKFDDTT
jgi:exopolysaccharide production protein ExoY